MLAEGVPGHHPGCQGLTGLLAQLCHLLKLSFPLPHYGRTMSIPVVAVTVHGSDSGPCFSQHAALPAARDSAFSLHIPNKGVQHTNDVQTQTLARGSSLASGQ